MFHRIFLTPPRIFLNHERNVLNPQSCMCYLFLDVLRCCSVFVALDPGDPGFGSLGARSSPRSSLGARLVVARLSAREELVARLVRPSSLASLVARLHRRFVACSYVAAPRSSVASLLTSRSYRSSLHARLAPRSSVASLLDPPSLLAPPRNSQNTKDMLIN